MTTFLALFGAGLIAVSADLAGRLYNEGQCGGVLAFSCHAVARALAADYLNRRKESGI